MKLQDLIVEWETIESRRLQLSRKRRADGMKASGKTAKALLIIAENFVRYDLASAIFEQSRAKPDEIRHEMIRWDIAAAFNASIVDVEKTPFFALTSKMPHAIGIGERPRLHGRERERRGVDIFGFADADKRRRDAKDDVRRRTDRMQRRPERGSSSEDRVNSFDVIACSLIHGLSLGKMYQTATATKRRSIPLRKGAAASAAAGVRRGGSAVAPLAAREALRGRLPPPHLKKSPSGEAAETEQTKFEISAGKTNKRRLKNEKPKKTGGLEEGRESCIEELAQHAEEFVGGHGVGSLGATEFFENGGQHASVENFGNEFGG